MNKEDRDIFDLMDDIPYEKKLELLDYINLDETSADMEQRARIKNGVMNRIKKNPVKKRNRVRRGIKAAGIIICLVITGISPFGQKAIADIYGKLFFIPGSPEAVEDKGKAMFILNEPVEFKNNGFDITVSSVTKDADGLTIVMDGNDSTNTGKLTIEDKKGNKYVCASYEVAGGGTWIGSYYFNNIPADVASFNILYSDKTVIPITLEKAESYADYASMGPTDEQNNVAITLVPRKVEDKIWFNLIQHPMQHREISIYGRDTLGGTDPIDILVKDDNGKSYTLGHPENFGTTSRFCFKPDSSAERFTVTLPEITLKYKVDNEVTLPMPAEGETQVNKTIEMHGFTMKITKIMRAGNKVTVYVDTGYDANKSENLGIVNLDMDAMSIDSVESNRNENVATDYFKFDINPWNRKLKIKFKDMTTIMKGPWTFEVSNR
ncbi:MAG: hypothetical protein Q8930_07590 [Bacillota bacterium]|nr:hypothetical protein [Bacillota bacterium]